MLIESLPFVAAVALGLTFVVSGLSKLRDPQGFVLGVLEYDVLPRPLAVAYGRVLPVAELLCGVMLLLGAWPMLTGLVTASLLLSFLVGVAINLARGRPVDCHCFGSQGAEPLGWPTVIRLIVLLAGAAVVAAAPGGGLSPVPTADRLPGLLLALGLLLGLYLLRTAPPVWRAWHTSGAPAPSRYGSRVSLRGLPLVPTSIALADRTREVSGCGACHDAKSPRERWMPRWPAIPGRSVSG